MANDDNIQLNSDFTSQQYSPPVIPFTEDITGAAPGGAVSTINGDAGAGASGPTVSMSGGSTGYSFTAVGTSITLTGAPATILAALGLSRNMESASAPTVNSDSSVGFSVNSLWTDTATDTGYQCMDSTVGAAVWKQITV